MNLLWLQKGLEFHLEPKAGLESCSQHSRALLHLHPIDDAAQFVHHASPSFLTDSHPRRTMQQRPGLVWLLSFLCRALRQI